MKATEFFKMILLGYMRGFPIDLGKNWLFKYIDFSNMPIPYIYNSRDNIKYELYLNEYISRIIYAFDIYERNTLKRLLYFIEPDMTFVDIGANMGTYSLSLSKYLSHGIFAFEPLSINYARLLRNIELSESHNIFPNKIGVLDRKGETKIYYTQDFTGLSSASFISSEHVPQIDQKDEIIELTDLDSYCLEHNIQRIDILKIDIEGAESLALKGAGRIIKNSPKMVLVIELNDAKLKSMGSSSKEVFSQINAFGFISYLPSALPFKIKQINSCPPLEYSDNLICVKNGKF